jgi:hypothetical protein
VTSPTVAGGALLDTGDELPANGDDPPPQLAKVSTMAASAASNNRGFKGLIEGLIEGRIERRIRR